MICAFYESKAGQAWHLQETGTFKTRVPRKAKLFHIRHDSLGTLGMRATHLNVNLATLLGERRGEDARGIFATPRPATFNMKPGSK